MPADPEGEQCERTRATIVTLAVDWRVRAEFGLSEAALRAAYPRAIPARLAAVAALLAGANQRVVSFRCATMDALRRALVDHAPNFVDPLLALVCGYVLARAPSTPFTTAEEQRRAAIMANECDARLRSPPDQLDLSPPPDTAAPIDIAQPHAAPRSLSPRLTQTVGLASQI